MGAAVRIVVAIDGSKSSEATLRSLATQFSPPDTKVRILNVVRPLTISVPPEMEAGYAPELDAQRNDARALVERAASTVGAAGFEVVTEVREGDVREMIIESAKDWNAELIVVGSHGHKGLPRLLLGSTAEGVARHAPCSVEIVRAPAAFPRILLVVDDSKFSDAAAQAVIRQERREHAEVAILHVVDLPLPIPTSYAEGFRQESLHHGRELVERVAKQVGEAGFKAEGVLEEGDPRSTIVDYAKKWGANLIVAGSHGRKGLDRFLMGSVAEFIMHHAPCSVQIVRLT